ncbi:MAG: hypothetical protein HY587_04605 [Candidatus Omnitrophica bacterium]|nr:hypothetical protein [Candidatus Omnitrophota bacterium]
MRRQLLSELGLTESELKGRKRLLVSSLCIKFGVLTVVARELRGEALLEGGSLKASLGKQYLAWQNSLRQDLAALFNGKTDDIAEGVIPPAIDPRFVTNVEATQ